MVRARINAIVTAAILLLVSCNEAADPDVSSAIDHRAPLGLGWDFSEEQLAELTAERRSSCRERVDQLPPLLAVANGDQLLQDCVFSEANWVILDSHILSGALRDGTVSIHFGNPTGPFAIEYSYLHGTSSGPNEAAQKARDSRFRTLSAALVERYGQPIAEGSFSQSSRTGFVLTERAEKPCRVWIEENVGILLCSQRVILVDGIEMSLSYFDLDALPIGPEFAELALSFNSSDNNRGDPSAILEFDADNPTIQGMGMVETLSAWVGEGVFRHCQSNALEPISELWALSDEKIIQFERILERYSTEELVRYALLYPGNYGIDPRDRNRHTLYLLRQAAEQESSIAQNEIGASLLYCYHGVARDVEEAQSWFEVAAQSGDALAMASLARMHVAGMIDIPDPIQQARNLLVECEKIDPERCTGPRQVLELLED